MRLPWFRYKRVRRVWLDVHENRWMLSTWVERADNTKQVGYRQYTASAKEVTRYGG